MTADTQTHGRLKKAVYTGYAAMGSKSSSDASQRRPAIVVEWGQDRP